MKPLLRMSTTPVKTRPEVIPGAPRKADEVRTPANNSRKVTKPPAVGGKGSDPMPKTAASYVYDEPVPSGLAFAPICPPTPHGTTGKHTMLYPELPDNSHWLGVAVLREAWNAPVKVTRPAKATRNRCRKTAIRCKTATRRKTAVRPVAEDFPPY